jgi:hypothetical protein
MREGIFMAKYLRGVGINDPLLSTIEGNGFTAAASPPV